MADGQQGGKVDDPRCICISQTDSAIVEHKIGRLPIEMTRWALEISDVDSAYYGLWSIGALSQESMSRTISLEEREPLASLVLYRLFKWSIVAPLLGTYFRGKVYGGDKVPKRGPLVLVSNHASYFDPLLLAAAVGRPVAYMAKEELFKIPLLSWGMRLYGAYPVRRGAGDRQALQAARHALKQGWIAGIFLEGTRTPDGRIANPKLGAALIAAQADVSLLPVSLWGTEKILDPGSLYPHPVPVTIRIGDPIDPPSSTRREDLEGVTQRCATAIARLHSLGR
jgi:1-acyl-sn-glycerol-3-phosphate acyltransferase